jgi:putative ABC transport system permease protein
MRPDQRELDDEIRGHIAISVKERIERGEDPVAARRAAYAEFGYVPAIRESMRGVWYSRWFDAAWALLSDMRVGLRSLLKAKGLAITVVVTLALGIGANAAIFSVVRGVLLRPLVNRGEDRLLYIRQSAPGIGAANTTFSVPEVVDFKQRAKTISAFGEFSTINFTLIGLGEPIVVRAGVVGGAYFDVMGLRPVAGRLLNVNDDGPDAAGAAVLTHRFWSTTLQSDPSVVGKAIRLGNLSATVVGVLEQSVPYPADTEIIANMVTSPHHMGALMVTERTHRMTELFGRLAPGATLEDARTELASIHATMVASHPESYSAKGRPQVTLTPLRDQIASPARTILLVLLAAAGVVFIIACSNVANLILARSVRRESELVVRAALGASRGALRRTLLAESLVLCGAGAMLGVLLARPFVSAVAQFAARFSVRALDVTVDSSVVWIGASLAMAAAVLLAYVPKLPSLTGTAGGSVSGLRITPGTNRRLRVFATTQIAFSFVMLAAAGTLVATLVAMQGADAGVNTRNVIVFNVPQAVLGVLKAEEVEPYQEMARRVAQLPGVQGAALGGYAPWRDAGAAGPGTTFLVDGFTPEAGEEHPRAGFRVVSPGYFSVLGLPLIEGRDFSDGDRRTAEHVAIVSQSVANRLFPNGSALNRQLRWTDPYFSRMPPRRIIGIVADMDDERIVGRGQVLTVYQPVAQIGFLGRLFVQTSGDPYALVNPVTRIVHEISANQPVERPATLEDVRAEVLGPERLKAFVLSGFAGIALLIAVVGVSGVLAFSVSARTREFGVRLAVGASPRKLLVRVLSEGVRIVAIGIATGMAGGYLFARLAASYVGTIDVPGAVPVLVSAMVLGGAAVLASLWPAARASRVDVLRALRSE